MKDIYCTVKILRAVNFYSTINIMRVKEQIEYKKYGLLNGQEDLDKILLSLGIMVKGSYEAFESHYTSKIDLKIQLKNGGRLYVQLKKLYDLRYNHLLPSLLESFLDAQKYGEEFLLIIKTKKISNHIMQKVHAFLSKYKAEKLNWVLIDESNLMIGIYQGKELSEKDQLRFVEREVSGIDKYKNEVQAISFSPIQQWLLKHLLLNGIEDYSKADLARGGDCWPYSWNENLGDYKVLAKKSGVSESSCFKFIKILVQNDYLEKDRFSYRFKKIDQLFKSWLYSFLKEKRIRAYLEPIKPISNLDTWKNLGVETFANCMKVSSFKMIMSGHMGALGGGLSWSNEKSVIFHALLRDRNELQDLLNELKLRFSDKSNSSIILNLNNSMYPVLKMREDAIKNERNNLGIFADPIQLYLDVHLYGARGSEQAEFIYNKILVKHFERLRWRLF